MQATAISDFSATVNGRDFKCAKGDTVEAEKATISTLEAIGLVTTKKAKAAPSAASKPKTETGATRKPRKEGNND